MVTQEAKDAVFGARLFYNGIMIFGLGIILYYDNDLQKAILSLDLLYFLPYFILYGISYYLFYTCGVNPGFVDPLDVPEGQKIELSIPNDEKKEGKESLLESGSLLSSANTGDLESGTSEEQKSEEIVKTRKHTKVKADTTEGGFPVLRYCETCKLHQPYRTKHCDKCERCVRKFDHHCFWIGGCVGELNHRSFWAFLFFQTILEAWTFIIANSGQDAGYGKALEDSKDPDNTYDSLKSPYSSSEYGAFTVVVGVIIIAFLFTGILLGFHTFLIVTNQTTWEFSKKDRITYLSIYPRGFYPFNNGLWENIKTIFLHNNKPKVWDLPPVYFESRRNRKFNWCENEYWECC